MFIDMIGMFECVCAPKVTINTYLSCDKPIGSEPLERSGRDCCINKDIFVDMILGVDSGNTAQLQLYLVGVCMPICVCVCGIVM